MAKSKRTPENRDRILMLLRAGNYQKEAFTAAGISADTFYSWMKEDPEFSEAVQKAESEAVAFHMAQIMKASQGGAWQASAWYLERKHPDRFGRQDRRPEGSDKTEIVIKWADEEGGEE
jgi:hypothetical protein